MLKDAFAKEYARHAALNLGQAARDVRYFFNHPDADKIAPEGTPLHVASSVTSRVPSLAGNLYYAALPPGLHHTPEDLAGVNAATAKEWFMNGYAPWKHDISDERVNAAIAQWKEEQEKNAGSRLREAVQFAEEHIGDFGKKYTMHVAGEPAGYMTVYNHNRPLNHPSFSRSTRPEALVPSVGTAQIDPKFRGMGLGKKLYGEVMQRQPLKALKSDNALSEDAGRVWEGMGDRGYDVQVAPDLHFSDSAKKWTASGRQGAPYTASLPAGASLADLRSKVAFKLQGHTTHQGLGIAIENRKGSVRSGVDKDGKPWRTEMKHPYGYIKGTKGADGEEIDAYVGPHEDATHAYVVHQRKHDGKTYDEDKVMLGFPSKQHAEKAYLAHYNDPKFLGPVKAVPMDRFKELVSKGEKVVKIAEVAHAAFLDELEQIQAAGSAR